ncbi:MAG TPA: YqgE/AlgH family protein [Nitrospirota bacterium]|nr:YqgE/AlgH family protein [Nitrospirota bacterium]
MLFLIGGLMRKGLFAAATVIATALAVFLIFVPAGEGISVLPVRTTDAPLTNEPDPFSVLPAKGKFLVATRNLSDPRFQETVILLIDYNAKGAAGLIINRPTQVPLVELFPSLPGLKKQAVIYYGGPVEGYRILMLIQSDEKPVDSISLFGNVYVSSSKNTLEHLAGAGKKGRQFRMYAGYAGWASGQLDREVSHGDWLVVLADAQSIFKKKSADIWRELFRRGPLLEVWNQDEHYFPSDLAKSAFSRP